MTDPTLLHHSTWTFLDIVGSLTAFASITGYLHPAVTVLVLIYWVIRILETDTIKFLGNFILNRKEKCPIEEKKCQINLKNEEFK